jgi:hypothetical protein
MVQIRRVALLLRATAERQLAKRPEALNYGLLVLHFLPPPVQEKPWVYTKYFHDVLPRNTATACWAAAVQIAIPVPYGALREPVLSGFRSAGSRLVCEY